jgi:uncharacterized protein YbgA (DUF1722 family)/uncharacterized protein YbbK (DUF523 family)
LGKYLEFVPVCPEAECGLGTPRDSLRLEGSLENLQLVTRTEKIDHTERMKAWSKKKISALAKEDLCGYIFKSKSPSCGMERIPVYQETGPAIKKGIGIFARTFLETFPRLPAEDDGRLHDPKLRENFIETLFTLKCWRTASKPPLKIKRLIEFHTQNKLLILSHDQKSYRQMGKLVASGGEMPAEKVFDQYEAMLIDALRLNTTTKKNINVLMHMMGFFKKDIDTDEKQELLDIIEKYRTGAVPLIVPMTLFAHYARKYRQPYLQAQTYLHPHPVSLKLRNHA